MSWQNRRQAGAQLAEKLLEYKNQKDTLLLGLPRGGVVVAGEVAKRLNLPLDILAVRKISAPFNPELAVGAVDELGRGWFNDELLKHLSVSENYLSAEIAKEKKEAERRLKLYRRDKPPLDLKNKTAILIDDGIATGATVLAGIQSAREKGAKKVIAAAPVIAPDTLEILKIKADEVVCLQSPPSFGAVGEFYRDFEQTSDEEVIETLELP